MNEKDVKLIRELAKRYMEIANHPVHQEKISLYKGVNDLKPIRPVVLMHEIPWHEMNFDGSLTLECEDKLCRMYEGMFKTTFFRWKHFPCDMYVEPFINVRKSFNSTGIGISTIDNTLSKNDGNNIISHEYIDQFETDDSLEKLHFATITYNEEKTNDHLNIVRELFGDTIPVNLTGIDYHTITTWDFISRYRGVTNLLIDLIERPEFMHKLVGKLTDIELDKIRQFEELGAYSGGASLIHCTAGLTKDLPPVENEKGTLKNVWGRGAAQIFGNVSRDMHEEFDIAYIKKVLDRCGLVYYGCCEPLHNKIDIVEKIKNLRKISVTPWADVDIAAECIGNRYVLASKPNPSLVAVGKLDTEVLKSDMLRTLEACKRNNTPCEFVLKDISTVGGRPENLIEWHNTAMETVLNFE